MANLSWYWHRLRAMSPVEMALHARKKFRQWRDHGCPRPPSGHTLGGPTAFPRLPDPASAPESLPLALRQDVDRILAGRWRAFGHLELRVDDPPRWHRDYLAGVDLATSTNAFRLNHRALPGGADVKLIWELSRWYELVRLAMAAHVLGHEAAASKCLDWLEDWVKENPPYRGWNWTSALEAGMRLVQFCWIDALLTAFVESGVGLSPSASSPLSSPSLSPSPRPSPPGRGSSPLSAREDLADPDPRGAADLPPSPGGAGRGEGGRRSLMGERLERLRREILPAHVWYAWRHRSFGSSANNHLIGELVGCLVVTVRWPGLARWGGSLDELQGRWEREVLAQFAPDGGNREQALNYQLFSWELCWQAREALRAAGRKTSPNVDQRLVLAARFFWEVQSRKDHWDYGDSDNAVVVPFAVDDRSAAREWMAWFEARSGAPGLSYWLGSPPTEEPPLRVGQPAMAVTQGEWWFYPHSGIAVCESGFWWMRWDLSPLGHLATAAHGHLDALHLSIWIRGVALVIDPGTGAYYADPGLRAWLASRAAHNGPCPAGPEHPARLGPFLWAEHHPVPALQTSGGASVGTLPLPGALLRRSIRRLPEREGWEVSDSCEREVGGRPGEFQVRWQFAPGSWVKRISERKFSVHRADVAMVIEVGEQWAGVELFEPVAEAVPQVRAPAGSRVHEGVVSPGFRSVCLAPFLKLTASGGDKPCVFRTTFLASTDS